MLYTIYTVWGRTFTIIQHAPNCNFSHKMAALGEDLHAGAFVASIADHEFAIVVHDSHLAGIPELALLFAGDTKLKFERAHFVKDLDAMIVRIGDNDLLIDAQTKAVRRIELPLGRAERSKFAAYLHGRGLVPASYNAGGAGRCHSMEIVEAHLLDTANNWIQCLQIW